MLAFGAVAVLLVSVARFVSEGGSPHARYLLPAVPVLAVAVSSGLARTRRRPLPLVVAAAVLAAMQWFMLVRFFDIMTYTKIQPGLPPAGWSQTVAHALLLASGLAVSIVLVGIALFDQRSGTGAVRPTVPQGAPVSSGA
jgi:hypothetical protein